MKMRVALFSMIAVSVGLLSGCGVFEKEIPAEELETELSADFKAIDTEDSSKTEEFVNTLLETSFQSSDKHIKALIDASSDEFREASYAAADAYGTAEYAEKYHEYRSWNLLNGLYKTLQAETAYYKKNRNRFNIENVLFGESYNDIIYTITGGDEAYMSISIREDAKEISDYDKGLVDLTREKQKLEEDKDTNKKIQMRWMGSGISASVSSKDERAYFFYADYVYSPETIILLKTASEKGLGAALGWDEKTTEKILEELTWGMEPMNTRLENYFKPANNLDYFNITKDEVFLEGYITFDNDMRDIYKAARNNMDGYNFARALHNIQ